MVTVIYWFFVLHFSKKLSRQDWCTHIGSVKLLYILLSLFSGSINFVLDNKKISRRKWYSVKIDWTRYINNYNCLCDLREIETLFLSNFVNVENSFLLIFVSESTVSLTKMIVINTVNKHCVSSWKNHILYFVTESHVIMK